MEGPIESQLLRHRKLIHGPISDPTTLCRPFKKHFPSRLLEPLCRHLDGDALPRLTGLSDPDSKGKRQRRWPRGRFCPGHAEYRAGLFRRLVGQAAPKKIRRTGRLLARGYRQATDGTVHDMAGSVRGARAGPLWRRHKIRTARCAHRIVRGGERQRQSLRPGGRWRQCGRVPGAAARCLPPLLTACWHAHDFLFGRRSRPARVFNGAAGDRKSLGGDREVKDRHWTKAVSRGATGAICR